MKRYRDSRGDIHFMDDDFPPKEDWVEEPYLPNNFIPDPNYVIPYQFRRQAAYPQIGDQLDTLYHDIENGVFGEGAKNSAWFLEIQQIKQQIPKV